MLRVARAVATGRLQAKVAVELEIKLARVKWCLTKMRALVAAKEGEEWLRPDERSAVEVASRYLAWYGQPQEEKGQVPELVGSDGQTPTSK